MKKGGNISPSLLISCAGWDTTQLMAFGCDKLSAFTATLPPWPLSDRTLFFSLVMKHSRYPHSSEQWWSIPSPPLSHLSHLPHSSSSASFWIWMNPGPFILNKTQIDNTRLQATSLWTQLSVVWAFVPCWVTICRGKWDKWVMWLMSYTPFGFDQVLKLTSTNLPNVSNIIMLRSKPCLFVSQVYFEHIYFALLFMGTIERTHSRLLFFFLQWFVIKNKKNKGNSKFWFWSRNLRTWHQLTAHTVNVNVFKIVPLHF